MTGFADVIEFENDGDWSSVATGPGSLLVRSEP